MGGWPNDIQNLRNTPFAAPTPVDSYYLNDRQDECGSSNTCDLGLAPGLYNSMITSYPDLIINNNNNMLNELYSINLLSPNKSFLYFFKAKLAIGNLSKTNPATLVGV